MTAYDATVLAAGASVVAVDGPAVTVIAAVVVREMRSGLVIAMSPG